MTTTAGPGRGSGPAPASAPARATGREGVKATAKAESNTMMVVMEATTALVVACPTAAEEFVTMREPVPQHNKADAA